MLFMSFHSGIHVGLVLLVLLILVSIVDHSSLASSKQFSFIPIQNGLDHQRDDSISAFKCRMNEHTVLGFIQGSRSFLPIDKCLAVPNMR